MISVYDQETATQMYGRSQYAEGKAVGLEEGLEQGLELGRNNLISEMVAKGLITKEQADELSKNSYTR